MHAPAALGPLTRLAIRAAHRVQQQVAKEEQARLLAQFTTLDYQTGASMATQQPRVIDASSGLGTSATRSSSSGTYPPADPPTTRAPAARRARL
jgi:hypothetical protein